MREDEVLSRVRAIFGEPEGDSELLVGIGDDGAVLGPRGDLTILASDMAVEGIHFNLDWSSAEQIGKKITAANLADICAMGGWPEFLLIALAFPERFANQVFELAEGIKSESARVGVKVIGGDLSKSNQVVISISAIGSVKRPILRSGARVGDKVLLSDLPGFSAAGLSLIKSGNNNQSKSFLAARLSHLAPNLDYEKYRNSFTFLNSAIDISDGLLLDASRIALASGVGIDIRLENLISSPSFSELEVISGSRQAGLDYVLHGGEDHLLLATSSSSGQEFGFFQVGEVITGDGIYIDGRKADLDKGYQHTW